MTELLATDWFIWGICLILGFQLSVVLLGEAIYRADRRTLPVVRIFRVLRNIVLPLGVLFILLTRLLEIDRGSVSVRLVETALWVSLVYAVLLVFNVLVFENANEASWRSRAPKLFQDLIRLLLVVIGAAIVLSVVWRQDLGGLVAALGVGSIVLGLALQETLGNLMSGIALFFERPFSVDEFISVGDKRGRVVQISWRSVHLRTVEGNLLVLPNSALARDTITNFSQPTGQQMLRLSFGFGLDAPPNLVKGMLLEVAREIPQILEDPEPVAVTCEVLQDRIRYEARVTIEDGRHLPTVTDKFTSAVWYAARRAGIALPLPHAVEMQVRHFGTDPLEAQQDAKTLLRKAEGIRVLPDEAISRLAASSDRVLFGAGEQLLALGEISRHVFVITSGEALGTQGSDPAASGSIHFGVDEVLGVTSLARAQASDTRVVALTDLAALRIPSETVAQALQEYPALSNQFARIWQARSEVLRRSAQHAAESTVIEAAQHGEGSNG
ncbi:MAG: mechanosensitive ion channel [Pseudomonadales bacterium]|nr:mechanosensitive ion channel [Halioglobus sp.]MCP5128782.1 mechanosensitive ion channel [Pseudomonadales bacterium]